MPRCAPWPLLRHLLHRPHGGAARRAGSVPAPAWAAVRPSLWAGVLAAGIGFSLATFTANAADSALTADGARTGSTGPMHGYALHGAPKYPPDFPHFDYVNPDAPKGGLIRLSAIGTFDNLNPFTLRGVAAVGSSLPFDTLMVSSADEPFSQYGLIAESIEIGPDRRWVAFALRPEARFHDDRPVTAEDVVFTFETLREHGHPQYRVIYAGVERAVAEAPLRVRFDLGASPNRELPMILGQLPVLPRHDWEDKTFDRTTLTPPLGSGPYRIAEFRPGRSITYERVDSYWGRNLPVNVGQNNFGRLRFDYYRDGTIALEALKAGNYDFRQENVARFWATAYDVPPVRDGLIQRLFLPHGRSSGMQAFVFNTRRAVFADPMVRKALNHAFDYDWTNRVLFFDAYARTTSYFSNTDLAAEGLPDARELALLEPFRDQLPEAVFTTAYAPPATDGGYDMLRSNLLKALDLLDQAGWEVREGRLINRESGRPMRFEILLADPSFERIVLPFIGNLRRLGIEARARTVDTSQYINRRRNFDFDMLVHVWGQSLTPGNEQRDYWGSASADMVGSLNLAGVRDPVVDALLESLVGATDRDELVTAARALDRVLLHGHYVIPHWHIQGDRLAFWDKFGFPETVPLQGFQLLSWWVDPVKAAVIEPRQRIAAASVSIDPEAGLLTEDTPARGNRWLWWLAGAAALVLVLAGLRKRTRRTAAP